MPCYAMITKLQAKTKQVFKETNENVHISQTMVFNVTTKPHK